MCVLLFVDVCTHRSVSGEWALISEVTPLVAVVTLCGVHSFVLAHYNLSPFGDGRKFMTVPG